MKTKNKISSQPLVQTRLQQNSKSDNEPHVKSSTDVDFSSGSCANAEIKKWKKATSLASKDKAYLATCDIGNDSGDLHEY